jgi:hypothetical protein
MELEQVLPLPQHDPYLLPAQVSSAVLPHLPSELTLIAVAVGALLVVVVVFAVVVVVFTVGVVVVVGLVVVVVVEVGLVVVVVVEVGLVVVVVVVDETTFSSAVPQLPKPAWQPVPQYASVEPL